MATYQAYSTEGLTLDRTTFISKQGYKLVPFDKNFIKDTNFSKSFITLVPGSCNVPTNYSGYAPNSILWGEIWPEGIDIAYYNSPDPYINTSEGQRAYHKAYAKFKDAVYKQAELLASIAERKNSFEMIYRRARQLLKAAKALRRGRFGEFLTVTGAIPKRKDKGRRFSRPKDFSSLWLEYWMGWAPLAGDIYTSANILGAETYTADVKVSASCEVQRTKSQFQEPARARSTLSGRARVYLKGVVEVSNPYVFKLNQLGLLNPLVTAWQLLPFSFIADWFLNIGKVLSQVSDWLGLTLKNLCFSSKLTVKTSWIITGAQQIFGPSFPSTAYREKKFMFFKRKANLRSLPSIRPRVIVPNRLSLTRGLTAISLLVQQLK